VTNQKFDIFIMIVIMLNMILMGLEHYEQSDEFENALYVVNTVFIGIFTTECGVFVGLDSSHLGVATPSATSPS